MSVTARDAAAASVRVLVEDRELAGSVDVERRTMAERSCLATAMVLQRGRWNAGQYADDASSGFGLLILSGLISGCVGRRGGYGAELLGPVTCSGRFSELAFARPCLLTPIGRSFVLRG